MDITNAKPEAADDFASLDCPMDILPDEVLSAIFDEFTSRRAEQGDEPASAALLLSHVCHRWTNVLTPSQWATIRVRHLNHQKIFSDLISRSQGHELDIAIRLGSIKANYYLTKDIGMARTQWRVFSLFNTLADNQSRLRRLTVEAKQEVLAWMEQIIIDRPLTLTHLSLIQVDKEIHMQNFAQRCFNLTSCVSLHLGHTSIILRDGVEWPSLRELSLLDIRAYEMMGWTYELEKDNSGQFQWESKQQKCCFASVEKLSISNTFFIRRESQIVDFLSIFPNVRRLELDCIDADLVIGILEKDGELMPNLHCVIVDGIEVKCTVSSTFSA